ncbi:MAG TPA: chemotaxis-specific protein-glutamate methyltransferase CheB [Chthonomonadales bacterium]|nr:chemotaxis-specific protein-glutamate methyltransferase CheB [Chthonomonadales bacterium]
MEPTRRARVLVVDDSALMRKLVSEILSGAGLEVVATARDGFDGLEKLLALEPDAVTLDLEMPRMGGIEFLREAMRRRPTPVVVLSSLTDASAAATIECLELGAFECLHKPSGAISVDLCRIGDAIARTVLAAARADRARLRAGRAMARRSPDATPAQTTPRQFGGRDAILAIASSTGGPAALQQVVPSLLADLPAAVVVVQHLPAGFTKSLAASLARNSALAVSEGQPGQALRVGAVMVAPAGWHTVFDARGCARMTQDPPIHGVRPAADVTLLSLAERFGSRVVAVVLTGMGRDGAVGARAVRTAGGRCLAQDEATSVVYGMPKAAADNGAADSVLPLGAIAAAADRAVRDMVARQVARAI